MKVSSQNSQQTKTDSVLQAVRARSAQGPVTGLCPWVVQLQLPQPAAYAGLKLLLPLPCPEPQVPINICEQRDPKGLYKKARAGKLKGFTGELCGQFVRQCKAGQAGRQQCTSCRHVLAVAPLCMGAAVHGAATCAGK